MNTIRRVRCALVCAAALAMAVLLPLAAEASTVIYRTDAELVSLSARVVHGRVLRQRTERPDPNGPIFTVTTMAVLEDFTGEPGDTVEVWELGGMFGGEGLFIGGQVLYGRGEEVLVFLERGPRGFRSVAMGFSKFSIARTPDVAGETDGRLTRALGDISILGGAPQLRERTLAEFRDLAGRVRGVRPIRNRSAEAMVPEQSVEAGFSFLGPARWFEADSGGAVTVYQNNNAPNPLLSGDAVPEIQNSLAGWTNPASASITLNYGGTTTQSAPTGPFSGVASASIVISYEDPQGNISGSTLAVGGGAFTSGGTVNGMSFFRFVRGYVLFQNAADLSPSFRQSQNFSRVVEHEIGHTIGIGHSDSSTSIMFPSCCSGSTPTPPSIGPDDLDAVTFIYPSGSAPPPSCSYTVTPLSPSAAATGGTGTISVTTTASCSWSAVSNATSVVTITGGASGTGSGTVSYSVSANTATVQRVATMTIAGQTVTLTQAAAIPSTPSCDYVVTPASTNVGTAATTGSFSVSVAAGCAWTAVSNASFVTITSGASGSGAGTVGFSVPANSAVSQRSGTLTIAGQTVTVSQDGTGPVMSLDKVLLNFGATTTGTAFAAQTSNQVVRLSQSGAGTVTWTATPSQPWITVSPASGTGPVNLTLGVQFSAGMPAGATLTGAVNLAFTNAGRTAGPVTVTLRAMPNGTSTSPFGVIDTPTDLATGLTGSIAVTGWALDDVEVRQVSIFRDPVAGEPNALLLVGNAVLVDGARPDVAGLNPTLPINTRGGWGYLLLSNVLPNEGNGTFRLHVFAGDAEGRTSFLGSRTITVANASSVIPFGAIDTPGQGEVISGANYANFGWVLSRGPALAFPPNGTVNVFVDGLIVGSPGAFTSRPDLTALFPAATYPGITNAGGVATLNTTTLSNGVHSIAWVVTDNLGRAAGIGSRFFTVANASTGVEGAVSQALRVGAADRSFVQEAPAFVAAGGASDPAALGAAVDAAPLESTPLAGRRGFDLDAVFADIGRDAAGRLTLHGEELDRFEVRLKPEEVRLKPDTTERVTGYLRVGNELGPLPIGSHLDGRTGVFTWQPGVGFVHAYDFVFVRWSGGRAVARQELRIVLGAKGSTRVGPQVVIDTPQAMRSVRQPDQGGRQPDQIDQPFVVAGWAIDPDAATGTGVETLHVWAYPISRRGDPIFLGATAYGGERPDVAAIFGGRFLASGYGLTVDSLLPGTYDLAVFAWSSATGGFVPASVVRVSVR